MDYGSWRVTKAQKEEMLELIKKLGWTKDFYEAGIQFKIDTALYFQAASAINGLQFLLENPTQWHL